MEYKHEVLKWNGWTFVKRQSTATSYYSIGSYMIGDDDVDEMEVETVSELYKLWQELKEGDKAAGEKGWRYHFYRHSLVEEVNERTGKPQWTDYVTDGTVYRRGNKVYFKAI